MRGRWRTRSGVPEQRGRDTWGREASIDRSQLQRSGPGIGIGIARHVTNHDQAVAREFGPHPLVWRLPPTDELARKPRVCRAECSVAALSGPRHKSRPTRTVQSVVRFDARLNSDGLVALREPGRRNWWAASAFRAGFTRTQVAAGPAQRSRGRVAADEGSVRLAGFGPCSVGGGASATSGSSAWPQRAASSARAWPRGGPRPPSRARASAPRGPSWATSRLLRRRRARRGMLRRVLCFG
jgi:hypothetical protein